MKTGKRVKKNSFSDNRGMSLVELIVVISIMAVMTGLLSLGVSMMFSRDSNYVAVRIDDALTETRMCSMSKDGTFTFDLHIDSGDPKGSYVQIMQSVSGGAPVEYKKILLDKKVNISVLGDGSDLSLSDVSVEFDKSKGNVKKINGSVTIHDVYTFRITPQNSVSKIKDITLISTTGRHYTEK